MNDLAIIYQANRILSTRKLTAEKRANDNFALAKSSADFSALYSKRADVLMNIAKLDKTSREYTILLEEYNDLTSKIADILKDFNLTEKDLYPNYVCKKCGDSGKVNGKDCPCYTNLVKRLREKALGDKKDNIPKLSLVNSDFIKEKDKLQYEKLCARLLDFTKKYPNSPTRYLVFVGATGTGKTYLAKAIAKEIEDKGRFATTLSSFALNNNFLKCHTTFDESNASIIEHLIETDVLVIDDLGTEPTYRNVSKEYLTNLISERNTFSKLTIITSNLAPDAILAKYGERLYSRVFDKNCSKAIYFSFENLRK